MGKSKSRSGSEVRHLQGRIRQLEAELKYYKTRAHNYDDRIEEIEEVNEVETKACPKCRGLVISYDFSRIILHKCEKCDYQTREKKR